MSFRVGLSSTFDSAVDFVRHVYTKPTKYTRCRRPATSPVEQKRLQTLGDAMLRAAVKQVIYEDYPDFDSGDMTIIGDRVLCNRNLAALAKKLKLNYAYYNTTKKNEHAIADRFEAHCAVIYQKGGMADLLSFVRQVMGKQIKSHARRSARNPFSSPAPEDPWQRVYPVEGCQSSSRMKTAEKHSEINQESAPEIIHISDDDDDDTVGYSDEGESVDSSRPIKRQRVTEAVASPPAGMTCEAVILTSLDPRGSSIEDTTFAPSGEIGSSTNKRERAAWDGGDGYSID